MIPMFAQEVWLANFRHHLLVARPTVPVEVAIETAATMWEKMMLMNPRDAVATFLSIFPNFYRNAEDPGASDD
jgi:hypothetical protein